MKLFHTQRTYQVSTSMDYHFFKHLDNFLLQIIFNHKVAAQNNFKESIHSKPSEFNTTKVNRFVYCWQ